MQAGEYSSFVKVLILTAFTWFATGTNQTTSSPPVLMGQESMTLEGFVASMLGHSIDWMAVDSSESPSACAAICANYCCEDIPLYIFGASSTVRLMRDSIWIRVVSTKSVAGTDRVRWTKRILSLAVDLYQAKQNDLSGVTATSSPAVPPETSSLAAVTTWAPLISLSPVSRLFSTTSATAAPSDARSQLRALSAFLRVVSQAPKDTQADVIHVLGVYPPAGLPAILSDSMGGNMNPALIVSVLLNGNPDPAKLSKQSGVLSPTTKREESELASFLADFRRPAFPSPIPVYHILLRPAQAENLEPSIDEALARQLRPWLPFLTGMSMVEYRTSMEQVFGPLVLALGGTLVENGAVVCAPDSDILVEVVGAQTVTICKQSADPSIFIYSIDENVYRVQTESNDIEELVQSNLSPTLDVNGTPLLRRTLGPRFYHHMFEAHGIMATDRTGSIAGLVQLNSQTSFNREKLAEFVAFSISRVVVISVAVDEIRVGRDSLNPDAFVLLNLVAAVDLISRPIVVEEKYDRSCMVSVEVCTMTLHGTAALKFDYPLTFILDVARSLKERLESIHAPPNSVGRQDSFDRSDSSDEAAVIEESGTQSEPGASSESLTSAKSVVDAVDRGYRTARWLKRQAAFRSRKHRGPSADSLVAAVPFASRSAWSHVSSLVAHASDKTITKPASGVQSFQLMPVAVRSLDLCRSAIYSALEGRHCRSDVYQRVCSTDPSHLLLAHALHIVLAPGSELSGYGLSRSSRNSLIDVDRDSSETCALLALDEMGPDFGLNGFGIMTAGSGLIPMVLAVGLGILSLIVCGGCLACVIRKCCGCNPVARAVSLAQDVASRV